MKRKKLTVFLSVFLILIACMFTVYSEHVFVKRVQGETGKLAIDSKQKGIPKNFRKSSDKIHTDEIDVPDFEGLKELNISGSGQFSKDGLKLLKESIGNKKHIIVVDLRQESHGFINGIPVSFKNDKNNANKGLTKDQVLADEKSNLCSIKIGKPITLDKNKETLTPQTVEDEEQVVKEAGMDYIRIPVTDTERPTDDMVDYFVNFAKDLPKGTWMHFHCKAGIGRTTTFMLMYDIMKNSKNISLQGLMKRQVLLGGHELLEGKDDEKSNSGKRAEFLRNFYKYCSENNDNFKTTWTEWLKNSSKKTSYFIKSSVKPQYLYVVNRNNLKPSERTLIASLQGLLANNSNSQIYILSKDQPDYSIWLDDMKNNYGIKYAENLDMYGLIGKFKPYISGYVLYSSKNKNDPSINNACTIASLKHCIVVDESLEAKVKSIGIKNMQYDCRNTDAGWAYNKLWNEGLNHSTVIELSPEREDALRDYGIMTKSLIFYENDINNTALRDKVFSSMNKNSVCLGWGPDEYINVSCASKHGISTVAADFSYNLSVLSSFPSKSIKQKVKAGDENNKTNNNNVHYVTFIMSDGDNQQWSLGKNFGSEKWYGFHERGSFNMGWTLSPSLYYLAPTVFNLYYKSAECSRYKDYFLVSPSGFGYMYPGKFDKESLDSNIKKLNDYMKDSDQKYVEIIDDGTLNNIKLWDKYASQLNINGLFYLDYHKYNNYDGKIVWANGKPVVSCRDVLWSGIEEDDDLVKKINDRVQSGETGLDKQSSYTFVCVHAWSKSMKDVQKVVNKLNNNPKVNVVSPDVFMESIIKNKAQLF